MPLKAALVPALGVASVFALLGLVAAFRSREVPRGPARARLDAPDPDGRKRFQHVPEPQSDDLLPHETTLPLAFWDPGPDSEERDGPGSFAAREELAEGDDGVDAEEIADAYAVRAEWLARATEAPPAWNPDGDDRPDDDPAEIAADSTSMISDASRLAAVGPEEQIDEDDERS